MDSSEGYLAAAGSPGVQAHSHCSHQPPEAKNAEDESYEENEDPMVFLSSLASDGTASCAPGVASQ